MSIIACIDGDIVAYRCAAVNENADLGLAIWQTDQLLTRILDDVNADDWKVYLSGENNFRYGIFPEYKANRRDQVKPKHLEGIREYLVTDWNATIVDGYEADDALGIALTNIPDTMCCSIDKDLLQVPGGHYNFVQRTVQTILENEGWKNFYTQLLVGDPTDNIKGCPGIGKVKAEKALRDCLTPRQLYERCVELYKVAYGDEINEGVPRWEKELNLNAQLLYVLRSEGDSWKAPQEMPPPALEAKQLS